MFPQGNPIILEGAGRIKTDALNEQRIEMVLARFEEWARSRDRLGNFKYLVDEGQRNKSMIAFPLAGLALGVLTSYGFVHPSSRYIGKFWAAFTTWVGYKVAKEYDQIYNRSRRFGNFWNYPADIRRMIDNNDARYAFRWLGDDYMTRADETA